MEKVDDSGSGDGAIYVRTTKALKRVVTDAAKACNESERWVVERLIQAFDWMGEEERWDVLQGRLALDRVNRLVALVSWANHAFSGHHIWAIECYTKLEEECRKAIYNPQPEKKAEDAEKMLEAARAKKKAIPSQTKEPAAAEQLEPTGPERLARYSPLRLFARYRLGFEWSELSLELRKRAMSRVVEADNDARERRKVDDTALAKQIQPYFEAAIESAKRASYIYGSIDDVYPGIPIICYNAACCAASTAMILVESSLGYGQGRDQMVTDLCRAVAGADREGIEKAWGKIGKGWRPKPDPKGRRSLLDEGERLVTQVDTYGDQAIYYLDKMNKSSSSPSPAGIPWPDYEYFPYKFWDDTDIVFLRKDSKYNGMYEQWAGTADDDWLLKSYRKLVAQYAPLGPM